jgi:hypothetical protein
MWLLARDGKWLVIGALVWCTCLLGADVSAGLMAVRPKLDGVLEAGEWAGAREVRLGYQVNPGNNAPPSEETRVWIGFDDRYLYLAAEAKDREPKLVRARVRPRDELADEDVLRVTLDTFHDRRRAYRFVLNGRGVQADGIFTEGSEDDFTWDGIFESGGRTTADGFVVEMAIPFQSLRFRASRELVWGLHLERVIPRKNEVISWMPIDRQVAGYLVQAGELRIARGEGRQGVVDVIPTFTGWTQLERTGPEAQNRSYRADPGLTVNASLTPNLTLSMTVNPDFSQVETDVPIVDVNQRFELFFPERRAFFLEGGEVFRPLQDGDEVLNLVNTRRIVDPDYGVKLTGKVGRFNVGYLAAADRGARMGRAQFHIGRVQRDLGRDSAVGGIFTMRSQAGNRNVVAGGDFRLRLNESWLYYGQHVMSWTGAKTGQAHVGRLTMEKAKWFSRGGYQDVGSEFRADAGFLRRTGYTAANQWMGYRIRPDQQKRWYTELSPQLWVSGLRTRAGKIDEGYLEPTFLLVLPRAIEVESFYSFAREHFAGRDLRYRSFTSNGSAAPYGWWALQWAVRAGGASFFDERNPRVGKNGLEATLGGTVRPTTRLSLEVLYVRSALDDRATGEPLVRQNIWRERTVFQFNRFWSWRSITEYNAARGRLGFNQLLTYLPAPNTAFYLGYNDLLSNQVRFGRTVGGAGFERERKVLFVKLSYNWRI